MNDLKAGDVVQFKSGGAKMTIANTFGDAGELFVDCVWLLNGSAKHGKGTFAAVTLRKAEVPQSGEELL